jgi:CelD/BcsL family acetyltransferase involved in cellulose biosynthesis
VRLHSHAHRDFDGLEDAWRALHRAGACSSLFSSWEWQSNWWRVWGNGRELRLYSFSDEAGRVVGIAPLYLQRVRFKKIIRLEQLQLIGNVYFTDGTVLSEYGDVVAEPGYSDDVLAVLWQQLQGEDWDECVTPLLTSRSAFYRICRDESSRWSLRHVELRCEGRGIRIDTQGGFEDYLAMLGKNTRLKLFNRRSLLQTLGAVELVYADQDAISEFLAMLNALDRLRWGRDCFGPASLDFHRSVAAAAAARGELRLSMLKVNGRVVSVLYNICFGGVEYNIQSAFEPGFHSKLSLGTLHMGYALERAFSDPGVCYFDLLFGNGKNEFYKRHYRGEEIEFFTLIASRSRKAAFKNRLAALAKKLRRA